MLTVKLIIGVGQTKPVSSDSVVPLGAIVIKGFETGSERRSVPASVSVFGIKELQRFDGQSFVSVLNTAPGVRMEERSPGSYRLSVRGSLLRSPFGIRNVKVYLDDFIMTDAGGNSYLNLLDVHAVSSVEIIKGPAGSIYGTGTGGVVNLSTNASVPVSDSGKKYDRLTLQLGGGSYGQFSQHMTWQGGGPRSSLTIRQGHYQSDGYRSNSRMNRNLLQADWSTRYGKGNTLRAFMLLSGLAYSTPGGLTLAQQQANPRQARPGTATLPSAETQRAGVRNTTGLFGISDTRQIHAKWQIRTAITGAVTNFENPFISNYEQRAEVNLGVRSILTYRDKWDFGDIGWISGFEWQRGFYRIDSSGNAAGEPSGAKVRDRIKALQTFAFTQAELRLGTAWLLQAGISLNRFEYNLDRTEGLPQYPNTDLSFDLQAAPRIAINYQPLRSVSLHASLTRGFSPPSIAEVRPSAGGFATGLQAERGWSQEAGVKGSAVRNRFQFDLTVFRFDLKEAIVRRTDASGAEFFVNAGNTRQQGIELFTEGYPVNRTDDRAWLRKLRLWSSITASDFRFGEYAVNNTSFKGKRLTGVPQRVYVAGMDVHLKKGFYVHTTFNHTGRLPLTDANDVYADAYDLWQMRAGWKGVVRSWKVEVYVGGDNLTNNLYSLGNDLNAFGRRFYNPAPARNFFGGLIFSP